VIDKWYLDFPTKITRIKDLGEGRIDDIQQAWSTKILFESGG
jgi:hypothetical protein